MFLLITMMERAVHSEPSNLNDGTIEPMNSQVSVQNLLFPPCPSVSCLKQDQTPTLGVLHAMTVWEREPGSQ